MKPVVLGVDQMDVLNSALDRAGMLQDGEKEPRLGFADVGVRDLPPRGDALVLDFVETSLGDVDPRSTDTHFLSGMYSARLVAHRVTFIFESKLDQDVTLQVIGSHRDAASNTNTHFDIGGAILLAAGDHTRVSINLDEDWLPYYGAIVTPVVAPTTGELDVTVVAQEWFPPKKP